MSCPIARVMSCEPGVANCPDLSKCPELVHVPELVSMCPDRRRHA
jgi:hypothetical protein